MENYETNEFEIDDLEEKIIPIETSPGCVKKGRPLKYKTEEERRIAKRDQQRQICKKYYKKHREELLLKVKLSKMEERKVKIEAKMLEIKELQKICQK